MTKSNEKLPPQVEDEIERRLVDALNKGYPESDGDQQTWDDKREAVELEFRKRFPNADEDEIDTLMDDFCVKRIWRPLPYRTRADGEREAASGDLLARLREAVELMPLGTAKRAKWLSRANATIAKAEER